MIGHEPARNLTTKQVLVGRINERGNRPDPNTELDFEPHWVLKLDCKPYSIMNSLVKSVEKMHKSTSSSAQLPKTLVYMDGIENYLL